MPYRQCPECGVTFHSAAGYSATSDCPVCGTQLPASVKSFADARSDIRRRLAREPVAAASARRELERFRGELDTDELEIVALLMTELIANSVLHSGPSAGTHLSLDVAVMPARVRVEVRDGGPGFTPTPRRPDSDPTAHWGLHLVDKLSDRWEVVAGKGAEQTLVWFELDRAYASSA